MRIFLSVCVSTRVRELARGSASLRARVRVRAIRETMMRLKGVTLVSNAYRFMVQTCRGYGIPRGIDARANQRVLTVD